MQIGAMKGSDCPKKWGGPRLMKIASSMTATRMMGRVMLFSTRAMMTKMAMMEIMLTTWKSWPVVSIMSFMQGASPMSIPLGSCSFKIAFKESSWVFTASLATRYSELIKSSSHLSLFRTLRTESGRMSSGTREPTTDSSPRTYLTPSTSSISSIMERTSEEGRFASTRSM